MAIVRQRVPSTGSPTSDGAAAPIYAASTPYQPTTSAERWMSIMRSPIITGQGTYTGTIAVPRNQPTDPSLITAANPAGYVFTAEQEAGLDAAALLAAGQRAQRAGLPASVIPTMADIFRGSGAFPDLSALAAGTGFGPLSGPQFASAEPLDLSGSLPGLGGNYSTGGIMESGLLPGGGGLNTWIILSVIGLGLLLLFGTGKGRR